MRKVALVDYGKLVLQRDAEDITAVEPGTVLVDVKACSICGSDIALFKGKRDLTQERYFGHEFSGTIIDAGAGANGIQNGMRVASELSKACGQCWNCRNGLPNFCKSMNEALRPGGFAEKTLVMNTDDYSFISPIPDTVDDITATILEPLNCAYHVTRQAHVVHGESVAVFGMGPMGILAARILKQCGIDKVIGLDNNKERIRQVRALGFFDVVDSGESDWKDQVREICGDPEGVDVVIELTGVSAVLQNAFDIVRRGGRITVGSVYSGFADKVQLHWIMRKELTIRGSKGPYPHLKSNGRTCSVDLLTSMKDDLGKLIKVYDYEHALDAFDDMMNGRAIKPVIQFR